MRSAWASGDCCQRRSMSAGGRSQPRRGVHSAPSSQLRGRRDLVGHAVGRHGGAEAVVLADQPVRHEAAVGEAGHAQARGIGEPLPHGPVDAGELDPRRRRRPRRRGSPRARRGRSCAEPRGSGMSTRAPAAASTQSGSHGSGPQLAPGPPTIESTSGSALRPAPRGAATVARIGPAAPGIATCSQATPASGRCQARAVARQPARRCTRGRSRCSSIAPGVRGAQRDDPPAAGRVAVHVRPRPCQLAPARRRAGSARARVCPATRQRARSRPPRPVPASGRCRVDLVVDEVGGVGQMQVQMAARARGRARSPPAAGTTQSESSQPYGSPSSSMPRNATCSPSGDQETALQEPARRARSRARSPRRYGHDVHGGRRGEIGALARIGAERDALAVGRPGEALDRPVPARQAPRARARARVLHEQVRVPVEVAVSVVPPVDAVDHARQRRCLGLDSGPTAKRVSGACRGERQPLAVGRERERADVVRQRGQLLGLAAGERHRPDLLVAQEEHAIALRRQPRTRSRARRRSVSGARATAVQRDGPDMPPVAARLRDAPRVERVRSRRG